MLQSSSTPHFIISGELITGVSDLAILAVYDPPEICIKKLHEVTQAGAEPIQLNLLFDDSEQMDRLAAEVLPYVERGS